MQRIECSQLRAHEIHNALMSAGWTHRGKYEAPQSLGCEYWGDSFDGPDKRYVCISYTLTLATDVVRATVLGFPNLPSIVGSVEGFEV